MPEQVYQQFEFKGIRRFVSPQEAVYDHEHMTMTENLMNDPSVFGVDNAVTARPNMYQNSLRLRPGAEGWIGTPTQGANAINNLQFYRDNASTPNELLISSQNDGKVYAAYQGATDWGTALATGVANTDYSLGSMMRPFSDAGVPVIVYKDSREQKQLRYISTTTMTDVSSVFGTVLGVYDQRTWLSRFSTAGSGGKPDTVYYSDVGDQQTFGASSFFQVGTKGLPIQSMLEYGRDFYIFNSNETFRWDTYQLTKEFNFGAIDRPSYQNGHPAGYLNTTVAGGKMYFSNPHGLFEYVGAGQPTQIMQDNLTQSACVQLFGTNKNHLIVSDHQISPRFRTYVYNPETRESINFNEHDDTSTHTSLLPLYFTQEWTLDPDYTSQLICARYRQLDNQAYFLNPTKTGDDFNTGINMNGRVDTQYIYGNSVDDIPYLKNWTTCEVYFEPIPVATQVAADQIKVFASPMPMQMKQDNTINLQTEETTAGFDWRLLYTIDTNDLAEGFVRFKMPESLRSRQIRLRFEIQAGARADTPGQATQIESSPALFGYRLGYNLVGEEATR